MYAVRRSAKNLKFQFEKNLHNGGLPLCTAGIKYAQVVSALKYFLLDEISCPITIFLNKDAIFRKMTTYELNAG